MDNCRCGCDNVTPNMIPCAQVDEIPPYEAYCQCSYDPFTDESKESDIQDLSFAQRKLMVMKCQMKKWRIERLQLESENRSLKQALKSFGPLNTNESLKTDPLVIHYREDNERLNNLKEELEDKLRELEEIIAERENVYDSPCDEVQYTREKIKALRSRFMDEKKGLKSTIMQLKLELGKIREESSCAVVNRLKMKIRELTKDGRLKDERDSLDREEMKRQNDRLLLEGETLRRSLRDLTKTIGDHVDVDLQDSNDSGLSDKLKHCETVVRDLKNQLNENKNLVENLRNVIDQERRSSSELTVDMDKMKISREALMEQVLATKGELQKRDNKVTALLRELRQSQTELLGMSNLRDEIESMKPKLYSTEVEKEKLLEELGRIRDIVSDRNDQIIQILEQKEKKESDYETKMGALEGRIDALLVQEGVMNKDREKWMRQISDLENEAAQCKDRMLEFEESSGKDTDVMSRKIRDLETELGRLNDEVASTKKTAVELQSKVDALTSEKDRLLKDIDDARGNINNLSYQLNGEKIANDTLRENLQQNEMELKEIKNERMKFGVMIDDLTRSNNDLNHQFNDMNVRMKSLSEENDVLKAENSNIVEEKGKENHDLLEEMKKIKSENDIVENELKLQLNDALNENSMIKSNSDNLRREYDKLKKEYEDAKEQLNDALKKNDIITTECDAMSGLNKQLKTDLNNFMKECDDVRKQLEESLSQNKQLDSRLNDALAETSTIKTDLGNSKREYDVLNGDNEQLRMDLNNLKKELEGSLKENSTNKTEFENLKRDKNDLEMDFNNLKKEFDDLREQLEQSLAETSTIKTDLGNLKREYDVLNGDNEQLRMDLNNLKKELEGSLEENSTIKTEFENLKRDKNTLETDLNNLTKKCDDVRNQLAESLTTSEHLNSRLNDALEENSTIKTDLENLKHEYDISNQHNKDLQTELNNSIKECENVKQELKESSSNAEKLNSQLNDSLGKITFFQDNIDRLKADMDGLNSKLVNTEDEKDKLNNEATRLVGLLNESQKDNEKLLRNSDVEKSRKNNKEIQNNNGILKGESTVNNDEQKLVKTNDNLLTTSVRDKREVEADKALRDHWKARKSDEQRERDDLERCKNDNKKLRMEIDQLKRDLEKLGGFEKVEEQVKDILRSSKHGSQVKDVFDADSWLKSLTLTQLADLHDKICLLTSTMVQEDDNRVNCVPIPQNTTCLVEDPDVLNKRIAALQRQIAEKQTDVTWKLQELRQALRNEQSKLISITDQMNSQRKKNLALQLMMDKNNNIS